uniref:Uncharacterized protein n=1 Tax=Anguilla anguilla TaxID=7936 RepID=A0A0E9RYW9_ANGAN
MFHSIHFIHYTRLLMLH